MRNIIVTIMLLCSVASYGQQKRLSYIDEDISFYYLYDDAGKRSKTLPKSIGELQGWSATFFVVRQGSLYRIYDAQGKAGKVMPVSSVGKILSVTGDNITSNSGNLIFVWDKNWKKIRTRAKQ